MNEKISLLEKEIGKAVIGKPEAVKKLLVAILAGGHILLDDVPGVGKTTMAVAAGRALGLCYRRIQFTPDVLPSDITGFSVFDRESGGLVYKKGVISDANLLLGDEINRTSSKTQSALLEAMEEEQVTVDGVSYSLKKPFVVIATQNHVGTAGTQLLPYAELDRFLMKLSLGYPDFDSQMEIIKERQHKMRFDDVEQAVTAEEVLKMQEEVRSVLMRDSVVRYVTAIAVATRESSLLELGLSPRGAISLSLAAKSRAYVEGRSYVTPDDVRTVLLDVCSHRVIRSQSARVKQISTDDVLLGIIKDIPIPEL